MDALSFEQYYEAVQEGIEYAKVWPAFLVQLYRDHPEISKLTLRDFFWDEEEQAGYSDQEIIDDVFADGVFVYFEVEQLLWSAKSLDSAMFVDSMNSILLNISNVSKSSLSTEEKAVAISNNVLFIKNIIADCSSWGVCVCDALGISPHEYEVYDGIPVDDDEIIDVMYGEDTEPEIELAIELDPNAEFGYESESEVYISDQLGEYKKDFDCHIVLYNDKPI